MYSFAARLPPYEALLNSYGLVVIAILGYYLSSYILSTAGGEPWDACTGRLTPDQSPPGLGSSPARASAMPSGRTIEAVPGGNQYGGHELVTLANHEGEVYMVLINGGSVIPAHPQVSELNWQADPNASEIIVL